MYIFKNAQSKTLFWHYFAIAIVQRVGARPLFRKWSLILAIMFGRGMLYVNWAFELSFFIWTEKKINFLINEKENKLFVMYLTKHWRIANIILQSTLRFRNANQWIDVEYQHCIESVVCFTHSCCKRFNTLFYIFLKKIFESADENKWFFKKQ